jgi:hypothetical protein
MAAVIKARSDKRINSLKLIAFDVAVCLSALCVSVAARAQQTTGDIAGAVTDTSGAAVPGANVIAKNAGTRIERTTTTSANGDFVFNLLQTGTYELTITAKGFESFKATLIQLGAGDRIRVDAKLPVGEAKETVTVEAQESALQTDSSTLSSTIDQSAVESLPLNGRNFVQLVQVQPGVNQGPPNGLDNGSRPADLRQTATYSANGQDDVLNNNMIDGADNIERLTGTIAVRTSLDAIDQVRVETTDYTADTGRTGGAVADVITKAGSNHFHGDVFEFIRNDFTDATNDVINLSSTPLSVNKSKLRWNQFGGSLGGPIIKNKAFFFGDYEGYRQRQGLPGVINTVPTLYEEQHPGDFSDVGGAVIPAGSIDPVALDYFKMYPAPNQGGNTYYGVPSLSQNSNDFDTRGDVHFGNNDSVFGRFILNKVFTSEPGNLPVANIGGLEVNPNSGAIGTSNELDLSAAVNYTHIFSASLLMNLFANYTRADNATYPHDNGMNPNQAFGQVNVNTPIGNSSALSPISVVGGTSLGDVAFVPVTHADNTFQYVGSVDYTRGRHNYKAGASLIRRQLFSLQSNYAEGSWTFQGYQNLLEGLYYTVTRNIDLYPPHFRIWEPSAYAMDNWRVRKNLTLNLGVRYDLFTPYAEVNNHAATFDPKTGAMLVAGQNGVSNTAGIQTDFDGLEPRLGAALDLGSGFVIRGGYGINFFPMNTTSVADLKNPPFVSTLSTCGVAPSSPAACPAGMTRFADGLPIPTPVSLATPGVAVADAVDPNYQTSYIHQYNLTVQKAAFGVVFTISYVGLLGKGLEQYIALNAAPPGTAAIQARRPYYSVDPNLGDVTFSQSHGSSNYNALQASADRKFAKGFGFNLNYTYAQSLGNSTTESEESQGGYGVVPSRVSTLDYGNSPLEVRHVIAGTISYTLPIGQNARGLEACAIKGWQADLLGLWSTSVPFTVLNSKNVSNTTGGTADRLDVIGNPNLSNKSVVTFFNPAAYATQATGSLGDERIFQYFGPHYRKVDVGMSKTLTLPEHVKLDFTAQAFNVLNTPNFGNPNATLTATSPPDVPSITLANINTSANPTHFGQITSMYAAYTPREFQFALKASF